MGRREKPLEPTAGPVQRLAHELRKLRVDAGGPTYREMARRVPYAAPTLSAAAAGERLPTLPVLLAYVRACDGDPQEWERRWYETVAEDADRDRADDGASPYPGLARFGPDDRDRFHGRDDLVGDLLRLTARRRVAVVLGASGSGKSSLLRAGLIPALRESAGPPELAAIRLLTPGDRPARSHADLFTPAAGDGDTLLVVDQFEEVFSLCHDPAERAAFLDRLLAARDPASRLRVLLAVRADFYGRCAEHGGLAAALGDAGLLVGPMSPSRLREAVVRPAAAERLVVERSLTARIVADVADEPGGLPLMAHALREVWRRRNGKTLTVAAYEAIGGVRGAVAHTAEDVYGRLSGREAAMARSLLLRMVAPGDGTQDTRRPVDRAELPAGCADVLERLVCARLLTVDGTTVELAHEALLSAWPRLRGWIEEDRERLRLHRSLTEAASAWAELARDPGAVYRGTRLAAAREAFGAVPDGDALELTPLEREFLDAGIEAHDHALRARSRAARRTRALLGALAVVLCLAAVAGAIAWQQNRNGRRQDAEAEARRVVGVAATLRTSDPVAAMRLSVAAWRIADLPETREAVRTAGAQREVAAFSGGGGAETATTARYLSADGRVLTVADKGKATRWDLRGPRRIGVFDPPGAAGDDLDVSADGRLIALATGRGVQVWDLRRERPVGPPLGAADARHWDGRFGPGGRTFLLQHEERGEVQVWDVRRHRLLAEVTGVATSSAPFSAMSPDDRLLATCSAEGRLAVRDVVAGRALPRTWPRALDRHACGAQEVLFTPDSRALAVPLTGGIRTWDVRSGRERPGIELPGAAEPSVDFSADGATAVALADGEVVLWRTADPDTPLLRHAYDENTVQDVRLDTADGVVRLRVSATEVRTLDVRDALAREPLKHPLTKARFSPDGRTLAVVERRGDERKVLLRDARDAQPSSVPPVLPGRWCEDCADPLLAFSPGGGTFAYTEDAARGTTVRQWDVRRGGVASRTTVATRADGLVQPTEGGRVLTAGAPPGTQDHDDPRAVVWRIDGRASTRLLHRRLPGDLVLTPDGRRLLTLNGELTDLDTGRTARVLRGEDELIAAAFSPEGRQLAVADRNGRIALWNGAGTRPLGVLASALRTRGDDLAAAPVIAFSADGRLLAVSAADGSVRVWETGTPRLSGAVYPATGGPVIALGFAGDELRVATAHRTPRAVPVAAGRAAAAVCERAGGGLTRQEWRTYLPNSRYMDTC
ncbi:hypothetical protein ACFWZ2_01605 [Streptomyces sp. NPDC059002]|uniref:nSTAND1 domain-containing NTPase n=1 Tax=Streptomyces sp. NPDC059002 TaxID=3346690 RepID=UPI00367D7096